jgi:hypothetical protein
MGIRAGAKANRKGVSQRGIKQGMLNMFYRKF